MGLCPSVSTMTQKLRTSTWRQDYGMVETLPKSEKLPVKWSNQIQKGNTDGNY